MYLEMVLFKHVKVDNIGLNEKYVFQRAISCFRKHEIAFQNGKKDGATYKATL